MEKHNRFLSQVYHFSKDFPAILLVFSIIIIASISSIGQSELFITWSDIGLLSILRLAAAFSLNFLPGYVILSIVGKGKGHDGLARLISSFFLSLFVMTVVGFVSAYLYGIVDSFYLTAFLLANVALVVVYFLRRLLSWRFSLRNSEMSSFSVKGFTPSLSALLLVLTVAFVGIWLGWQYAKIDFFIGGPGTDMWRHHGFAQSFLDGRAFTWLHIPWWFHLYLACFTIISGVPSANAYFALYPLIILSVLSFYVMVSSFFKDRRVASIATLAYAVFSGPAWLYAFYLRHFSILYPPGTPWTSILYETGDKFLYQSWYPPFVVGFNAAAIAMAGLWFAVYATRRLDLQDKFNFFLLTAVVALSYLLHGIEPLIFVVYLTALLLICLFVQNAQGKRRVRWAAFSIAAALTMVATIDVLLTSQYNRLVATLPRMVSEALTMSYFGLVTRTYYYFNSPSFYLLSIATVLLVIMTFRSFEYRFASSYKFASKYSGLMSKHLLWYVLVFYLFATSWIVWIVLLPHAPFSVKYSGLGVVPWYMYFVAGGVPFLVGLLGAAYWARRKKREKKVREVIVFYILSLVLLFVLGQATSFVNAQYFYTGFWERRVLTYMHPMISVLMAYALVIFFSRVNLKKPSGLRAVGKVALASILISLLVLSSASSTLLAGDFASDVFFAEGLTAEELEALAYLRYSLPAGAKTAYLNLRTGSYYIRSFANDKWNYDSRLYLGQFEYVSNPKTILFVVIGDAKTKLLYLHHTRDNRELEANLFIQQLIKLLPVEFNNSEVTIYSVPPLSMPSYDSSLGIIDPNAATFASASFSASVLWFSTFAMSDYSYAIKPENFTAPIIFDGLESLILPVDPLHDKVFPLLEWVRDGGHLVVSNTNSDGAFAELFGLISKDSLVNCDSVSNWSPEKGRGEISTNSTNMIEGNASLRLKNDQPKWEEWLYTFPETKDLTGYESLGLWIYGTGGGPNFYVYLADKDGKEKYYLTYLSEWDSEAGDYVPSFTGWKRLLIPIEEYYSGLNLTAIEKLKIVTGPGTFEHLEVTYEMKLDILIDDIFALKKNVEGPPTVSADGIEGIENIDLPSIEVQNLNPSEQTRIVANYTSNGGSVAPFAIEKDFGKGRVTYLNIDRLYEFILYEGSELISAPETLVKILEIIDMKLP